MKSIFFCTLLLFFVTKGNAQTNGQSANNRWDLQKYLLSHSNYKTGKSDKPALDYDAMDNWESVGPDNLLTMTNDGKYFIYGISKGTLNPQLQFFTVKSTTGTWQKEVGRSSGFFSADSREYIFQDKEELCFVELGTSQTRRIKDVLFFGQPFYKGKGEWLAYQLKTGNAVVLQNLLTGKEKTFTGLSGFQFDNSGRWFTSKLSTGELFLYDLATTKELRFPSEAAHMFDANGRSMILQTAQQATGATINALYYVSLPGGEQKKIWESSDSATAIRGYMPDDGGKRVVFSTVKTRGSENQLSIWYWKDGMDRAEVKINNQSPGISDGLTIAATESIPSGGLFSGKYILFMLQPVAEVLPNAKDAPIKVDVWSYNDTVLLSQQPFLARELAEDPKLYMAAFNPETGKLVQVEKEGDSKAQVFPKGDFSLAVKLGKDSYGDRFWEAGYKNDSIWLVSLKDGSRRLLPIKTWSKNVWFSPGGDYLVYFDLDKNCNYFSYNLRTGVIVNISAAVPSSQLGSFDRLLRIKKTTWAAGIAGWLQGDKGLLVYDEFDIWQLDLSGKKTAVNITGGYGRTQQIMFSMLNSLRGYNSNDVIGDKDSLLLRAFNQQTKYAGYYRKLLGTAGNPELLYMKPCSFQNLAGDGYEEGMQPKKAAAANLWIVKKQTPTEAPNYFVTTDFKNYRALTDIQSHKSYNWLSSELVSFKQLDGTVSQGILYKPENFDPSKKYPVIISFYTHLSDRVFQYPTPVFLQSPNPINNPAWLLSHGSLVFLPDIYFTQGQWGPSTVNTVEGAARYLKTLPYVDGEKLGATGHSNSGRFGFYLLSHSTSFAAISVGEGTTNILSGGLGIGLLFDGNSMLEWAEQGSVGTGLGMLWKNKTAWLDHSAVLNADKITSPLLLFDNKEGLQRDQAAELFTSMRRLDKKAWWLHYDNGGHYMAFPLYVKDFTVRFTQFFDHYLKGTPAPQWMVEGIPYKLKGLESRYELDPAGSCTAASKKECPVCKAWNAQFKRTPQMFEKPLSEWKLDSDLKAAMEKEKTAQYNENMKGEAQRIRENNAKLGNK